jgi:predicted nucleic acid-binding protein
MPPLDHGYQQRNRGPGFNNLQPAGADILIAATALEHGLSVVTRNEKHFIPTGVPVVNPF